MIDEELDREFDMPVSGVWSGQPIPDLTRIAKRDWPTALTGLTREVERMSIGTLPTLDEQAEAMGVTLSLPAASPTRRQSARYVKAPEGRRPPRRAHQVNVRLYGRDRTALVEAAALAGTTPTELARWLIVSGTRRMLFEERKTSC